MSNYKIFKINGQGKGTLTDVPPEDIVEIGSNLSAGSSDGGVITEDSDTVAFTGNGTAGNPLSAESVGGETLTAEQIKALYESNANTNAFTDNEKTKLAGLENFDPTPINEQLALKANQLTTYTKTEVDGLISATYRAKGSVNNFASLPTTGNKQGDVWNLIDTGANYVWILNLNNTGIAGWDNLSGVVDLSSYATISAMNTALGLKVDKIAGKGLSESDFTSAEKTKLSEIATGANNYVLPVTSGTVLGGVKEVYLTQSAYNALTPKLTDVKYHIEKI